MANEDMANEDMANEDMANEDMANEDMANEDMANEDMANKDMENEYMTRNKLIIKCKLIKFQKTVCSLDWVGQHILHTHLIQLVQDLPIMSDGDMITKSLSYYIKPTEWGESCNFNGGEFLWKNMEFWRDVELNYIISYKLMDFIDVVLIHLQIEH